MFFYYPFYIYNMYRNTAIYRDSKPESYFRIFHASPNTPSIDIYLNDKLFAKNLSYGDFTNYTMLFPGTYKLKIYYTGSTTDPIINKEFYIKNNTITTGIFWVTSNKVELKLVLDPVFPLPSNKVSIRVINLSINLPPIDISLTKYKNIFPYIASGEITNYKTIDAGIYTVNIDDYFNDHILTAPNMELKPNRFYSIYIIGFGYNKPTIEIVVALDGNSYIKF